MKNAVVFGMDLYSVSNEDISRLIKTRAKYLSSRGDTKIWGELNDLEEQIKKRSRVIGKIIYKS